MTVRENIQILHRFEIEEYLEILKTKHGAKEHPKQAGCFLVDDLPFYKPKQNDEYINILGFNLAPLPGILISALANHPELVPDDARVVWTIEQELFLQATLGEIRERCGIKKSVPPLPNSWKKPYEAFGITEDEVASWRVSDERLKQILADPGTIAHTIKTNTNTFGEFLFLTASRGTGQKRVCMTFYGMGYHEYRERWLSKEWFWYQSQESLVDVSAKMPDDDVKEKLKQRFADIAPDLEKDTQTERGKQFETLADMTDDDAALVEMKDLGLL